LPLYTCTPILSSHTLMFCDVQDCKYGDRSRRWCTSTIRYLYQCYSYRDYCCGTCNYYKTGPTGEPLVLNMPKYARKNITNESLTLSADAHFTCCFYDDKRRRQKGQVIALTYSATSLVLQLQWRCASPTEPACSLGRSVCLHGLLLTYRSRRDGRLSLRSLLTHIGQFIHEVNHRSGAVQGKCAG